MSDTNGGAPAPVTAGLGDLSRFDKFFGAPSGESEAPPAPAGPESQPKAPTPEEAAPPKPADPKEPEAPKSIGLAEKIRADREAKAAAAKRESEEKTLRQQLEEANAKLARFQKSDVVADPLGWIEAMGLDREEQAVVGETLLYGLVPDKATPEVRIKLMEARQARKEKLAAEQAEAEAKRAQEAQVQQVHEQYIEALAVGVESLPPGTNPDSEAWFGEDHEAYVRSLYATANNLAETARAQGRAADLSFAAVAKVLEQDIASRAQRLRSRGATPIAPKTETPPPTGEQPVEPVVVSTKVLGGSAPRPPATSEQERLKRAMEVAFRTK